MYSIIFNQSAKEINGERRVVSENSVGPIGYQNGKQWTLIFISHSYSLKYRYNCRSYINFLKKPEDNLHDIKTGKDILVSGRDTPTYARFMPIVSFRMGTQLICLTSFISVPMLECCWCARFTVF